MELMKCEMRCAVRVILFSYLAVQTKTNALAAAWIEKIGSNE
jgi:hypothetical protein